MGIDFYITDYHEIDNQNTTQVNHNLFLGYTKDENKHLVIDPEGAEIVKKIYREYLEGASLL